MPRRFFRKFAFKRHELSEQWFMTPFRHMLHDHRLWGIRRKTVVPAFAIGLFIAFMPFLILACTFKNEKTDKLLTEMKITTPGEFIKIIFAPVIIVFSVSISLIFMTALTNTLGHEAKQHEFFESL